ncbi:universal stress protein [Methylocystis heyeri]|uniref:Universal stress protein n=1 Tax=Methylocystis heyeri TaxID=391905 RepID=A0A6B8KG91_9HYPH|nr:universal stress protein [Methylocystis heyeri]QGM46632.1 universal stress protein [Methylocystis heyeri]
MLGKILLPVDLTQPEMTKLAIDQAKELASAFNCDFRLVNVQSLIPISFFDYVPQDFDSRIRQGLEEEIAAIAQEIGCGPDRISTKVLFGPVYHKLLEEAETWGADLILLCSHKPGMDRFLIGSTADAIVQHAKCSVWVVRAAR